MCAMKAAKVAVGLVGLASAASCQSEQCLQEEAALLQITARRGWGWHACKKWLDATVRCLQANTFRLASSLPNVTHFDNDPNEGFSGHYVSDGRDDMFDDANKLSVSAQGVGYSKPLNYTQQCDGTWASAGVGDVEYFTCRMDLNGKANVPLNVRFNASTVWYAGFRSRMGFINGVNIHGELGSDGKGFTKQGSATLSNFKGLYGHYTQTLETGDPSIKHLYIVPDDGWIASATDALEDLEEESEVFQPQGLKLSGNPVHAALYAMWGVGVDNINIEYTPEQFHTAFEAITASC